MEHTRRKIGRNGIKFQKLFVVVQSSPDNAEVGHVTVLLSLGTIEVGFADDSDEIYEELQ